ncbi:pseudouridine synthase [Meredithblackwellia eburnea MCA 4105]
MPKAPPPKLPLSCLFAINKPSGQPSMTLLNKLQPLLSKSHLFAKTDKQHPNDKTKGGRRKRLRDERVKIGQGGTLDPLADGVLVCGTNDGTKKLQQFLDCSKEYRAIGLFGCSTDSYDSEGKIVNETSWDGVTAEAIENVLERFRGEIEQVPPIFSALKMDGKPLYEYARNKIPLPRPIASRKVTVHQLSLLKFTPGEEHSYEFPKEKLEDAEKGELERIEKMVKEGGTVVPETLGEETVSTEASTSGHETQVKGRPPIFEISMTVSSGTYVRSIVHDIATALQSSAHVVKLTRTRQGEFGLNASPVVRDDEPVQVGDAAQNDAEGNTAVSIETALERSCIEWSVFEEAIEDLKKPRGEGDPDGRDEDGWLPWERELLSKCQLV